MGDLFTCILKLDSLLELQALKEHWFLYRRLIKNMYHNHTKYDFEREQLSSFDKTLMVLENDLLMGRILKVSFIVICIYVFLCMHTYVCIYGCMC